MDRDALVARTVSLFDGVDDLKELHVKKTVRGGWIVTLTVDGENKPETEEYRVDPVKSYEVKREGPGYRERLVKV